MSRDNYKTLIKRYADGRLICNCGEAYLTPCASGLIAGVWRHDIMACAHGCEANRLAARDDIAGRIIDELIVLTVKDMVK